VADVVRTPSAGLADEAAGEADPGPWSSGLLPVDDDDGDDGLRGARGLTDCAGNMSRSGSEPMVAFGAGSGRASRWDERADPAGEPRLGTVDSVEPDGADSSMVGSDMRGRDVEPAGAGLTTADEAEPQLVQGAETVLGAA
jgi:hypothetical protein